VEKESC